MPTLCISARPKFSLYPKARLDHIELRLLLVAALLTKTEAGRLNNTVFKICETERFYVCLQRIIQHFKGYCLDILGHFDIASSHIRVIPYISNTQHLLNIIDKYHATI